jgi:SAM-dependent methyltransferase
MKWALKIAAKILISRLPIPYDWWRSFGIFRHGQMDNFEYCLKIFKLHADRAYPSGFSPDLTMLELGPGDSIASAIIANAFGANKTYLVDIGNYANKNIVFYKSLVNYLRERGLNPADLSEAKTIDDVLRVTNSYYLTGGLESLKRIESSTIDFVWSHSVLEHIRKHEVDAFLKEIYRVMKSTGYASHNIDFQDHLEKGLNNLRFSEKVWESALFVNSGFYTNRIPAIKMHSMFRDIGFIFEQEQFGRWSTIPTPLTSLHEDFQIFSEQELINRTSHVLLRVK